ncbi:sigma-70 family RNA polymerase sigma factor, partial [Aquiluna sp.]|nr:sigma-70 family RNA polymerase sigma factor [Aquiluna sp.]
MPGNSKSQEDFEQLSEIEQSMESFSLGELDSKQAVTLKNWSAQDFANIYVRFRPHLISHARKFLREETQAEEVVQDAFLYLMTALPELDSELGVLKFLKWKTKMICIDLIRASSRIQVEAVPDDLPAGFLQEDLSSDLERAEDAAIVVSALASLSPRHREALISSIYLEQSYGETAKRMGLSENAFRQLLYRAKKTFRFALVGRANVEGKSVAQIISLAVRKASSGHVYRASSVALLVCGLLLGLTYLPAVAPVTTASESGG